MCEGAGRVTLGNEVFCESGLCDGDGEWFLSPAGCCWLRLFAAESLSLKKASACVFPA